MNPSNNMDDVEDKEIHSKCALCGKSAPGQGESTRIQEVISGTSYTFDTQDCLNMFKRFKSAYGDEFKGFHAQEQFISDPFWDRAIPKEEEIREIEIEKGRVKPDIIQVIQDLGEIRKIASEIVRTARHEILIIFSTSNAFHRPEHIGGVQLLKDTLTKTTTPATTKRDLNIRILTPLDDQIKATSPELKEQLNIDFRYIEESLQTKMTILVVDRVFSLAVELKDDQRDSTYEATYSSSKSTVLSYVAIFESLWKQVELNEKVNRLYEQLKIEDKLHRDFINVAAHELRAPIQPILGLTEVIRSRKGKINANEQEELLAVIIRNAKRLKTLTENILDINRIESRSLSLNKETLDLDDVILDAIQDIENQIDNKQDLRILYDSNRKGGEEQDGRTFIEADRNRITQVISNLLSNAINFTKTGTIHIYKEMEKDGSMRVIVKDTGSGIDPEILPRLFTKFTTKSNKGTGLGLFISKNIVEAHGGKIWGENNQRGKGAVFGFSLPRVSNS
jgi:two-component system, OmpR family, sensor histidine kinase VicK